MDLFINILGVIAAALIFTGIAILSRPSLEIGSLVGFYPLLWGIGIGALAALLWAIEHLRFNIV